MSEKPHEPGSERNALSVLGEDAVRLPMAYKKAKDALAKCNTMDECKDWADKAAAVASYALMANNPDLLKMTRRIQARAARRCGILLQQFDGRPKNASKQNNARGTLLSQKEAAQRANLSKRKKDTFLRVANVPEKDFETKVESSSPPTITILARLGIKSRASVHPGRTEEASPRKAADSQLAVENAIAAMRSNSELDHVEPTTKARKALVRSMKQYPLTDLWWAQALLSHMNANHATGDAT